MSMKFPLVRYLLLFIIVAFALFGLTVYTYPEMRELNIFMDSTRGNEPQVDLLAGNLRKELGMRHTMLYNPNIATNKLDVRIQKSHQKPKNDENQFSIRFAQFNDLRIEFNHIYKEFEKIADTIEMDPFSSPEARNHAFADSYNYATFKIIIKNVANNLNKVTNDPSNYEAPVDCYFLLKPMLLPSFRAIEVRVMESLSRSPMKNEFNRIVNKLMNQAVQISDFCYKSRYSRVQ